MKPAKPFYKALTQELQALTSERGQYGMKQALKVLNKVINQFRLAKMYQRIPTTAMSRSRAYIEKLLRRKKNKDLLGNFKPVKPGR